MEEAGDTYGISVKNPRFVTSKGKGWTLSGKSASSKLIGTQIKNEMPISWSKPSERSEGFAEEEYHVRRV